MVGYKFDKKRNVFCRLISPFHYIFQKMSQRPLGLEPCNAAGSEGGKHPVLIEGRKVTRKKISVMCFEVSPPSASTGGDVLLEITYLNHFL